MYTEIKECLICQSPLTQVMDLGNQYVVDFPKEKDESLLKAPLVLMRCNACSLIQLKHAVSGERLYKKFWYRSGINEQMKDELLAIVQNAEQTIELKHGDKVLDIGCNDGTLLGWYNGGVLTVGVDPCEALVQEGLASERMDIGISDFFTADAISGIGHALGLNAELQFKIITSVAMFYDLPDPVQFLRDCKSVLHKEGVLVIQMNYLLNMLKDSAFDFISHEHRAIYSVMTLNRAIDKAGLSLQGVQISGSNGGSIRAFVTHPEFNGFCPKNTEMRIEMFKTMNFLLTQEIKMHLDSNDPYTHFAESIDLKMNRLRKYLDDLQGEGYEVYVYGASTRGTALMQALYKDGDCALKGVAERDTNKIGRCMVGTWLPIISEATARSSATHMLVLPWHFRESILKREENWLDKRNGTFIFPLPSPTIVKKQDMSHLSSDLQTQGRRI